MKINHKTWLRVGRGRPEDIKHSLDKSKVPASARVTEIGSETEWVNGPSTSGNVRFVTMKFEWETNV